MPFALTSEQETNNIQEDFNNLQAKIQNSDIQIEYNLDKRGWLKNKIKKVEINVQDDIVQNPNDINQGIKQMEALTTNLKAKGSQTPIQGQSKSSE